MRPVRAALPGGEAAALTACSAALAAGTLAATSLTRAVKLLVQDYQLRRDIMLSEEVTTDHGSAREADWAEIVAAGIESHVKPLIGNRTVRGLTVADLERFQADITAGKTIKPRSGRGGITTGGAGVAGRTLGMLHTIFEQGARSPAKIDVLRGVPPLDFKGLDDG